MNDHDDASVGLGNRTPPPTIYDIAKTVGVSPSTVSRALTKPGRLNAHTERRIREAAATLGYRTNPMARALPTGRTGTFAVVLSDVTNPVYFDLVRAAEKVTSEEGLTLVIADAQESSEVEIAAATRLAASVDGIVLVASRLSDDAVAEVSRMKPVALVNRQVDEVPGIVPDPVPGVSQALDHLGVLGHRSIGYLAGPAASWMNRRRWDTLFDLAVERSMSIVEIGASAPTVDGGAESLRRVRASGVGAVFAYNDLMAMGLIRAAVAAGVSIPDDLSVVGFDDIFGADLITPSLTTIRSPLAEAGDLAIRSVIAASKNIPSAPTRSLQTALVVRQSTGPVPVR